MLSNLRRKLSRGSIAAGSAGGGMGVDNTPMSDESLPRRQARERRRSSLAPDLSLREYEGLPAVKDTPPARKEAVFRSKLDLCSIVFNFEDLASNKEGKELKRTTLLELVDYVNMPAGAKIFTETVMPHVVTMVAANLFRALPPVSEDFDPDEDEPVLDPAWPHLQVVYEFLLRFVVTAEVKAKVAKRYVTQDFCMQLLQLFDSEDPRERDYLKTILHRIYGKFMMHRAFIRRALCNTFLSVVYETGRHNGVAELLEILGSIINGFALPLKPEHIQFLERALVPLHRPAMLATYHQQLAYCITQFVDKDPDTGVVVLRGLLRCWPWSNSTKQVLFLNELEEVLEMVGHEQLKKIAPQLFGVLARCVSSEHFQVVERALFLWNNEQLLQQGCLSKEYASMLLPRIVRSLLVNAEGHWNPTVESLAQNVVRLYRELDPALLSSCCAELDRTEASKVERLAAVDAALVTLSKK